MSRDNRKKREIIFHSKTVLFWSTAKSLHHLLCFSLFSQKGNTCMGKVKVSESLTSLQKPTNMNNTFLFIKIRKKGIPVYTLQAPSIIQCLGNEQQILSSIYFFLLLLLQLTVSQLSERDSTSSFIRPLYVNTCSLENDLLSALCLPFESALTFPRKQTPTF